ncbi:MULTISPECIES: YrhA family protein [Cytobacillus]|uniref:SMI1/KNR4 family protein n=1 Tax=Cytobacillus firmus TaxID=1399 RepID=A0AA46PW41_CYTFI|nr:MULTISPECIES: YrhA family protein [Cytobacillus]MCM3245564.1 SMI1/KNR4 family protein [Cytobacillus oceanisediminis]UYG98292.1 SMI1/KNR4 family protein [Cytobacillus firmus]
MAQWKELLNEIKKIEEKYGSSLRDPVTDLEIRKLQLKMLGKLGYMDLPKTYIELLKTVNGLDFNGLVIYGVDDQEDEDLQGLIETNEIWYKNDWQKQYIFFGDSDTAWYCLDLQEGMYHELDKPSGTLIQSFDSFDSMLSQALQTALL